jgi:hypothetical protein
MGSRGHGKITKRLVEILEESIIEVGKDEEKRSGNGDFNR